MAMRMTGLMSGMDTESLIQELVAARRTKVDKVKKAQTKHEWKQEAWKDVNSKLKNLQSKYINNMRFATAYGKKTTKASNSSAVNVITGENAMNGVQELEIERLAKTAYLTGSEVSGSSDKVLATDKISTLNGYGGEGVINLTMADKSVEIKVSAETTISDILTQLKDAGLNASFDANNQRFFISAKESGEDYDFSLTASDAGGAAALKALGLQVGLDQDAVTKAEYEEYAGYFVAGDRAATLGNMQTMIDSTVASKVNSYLNQYKSLLSSRDTAQKKIDEINDKYKDTTLESVDFYKTKIEEQNDKIKAAEEALKTIEDPDSKRVAEEELAELKKELADLTTKKTDAETLARQTETVGNINAQLSDVEEYVAITTSTDADGKVTYSAVETSKLIEEVENSYYNKAAYAAEVIANPGLVAGTGATKIKGEDAVIYLNGARFEGNDNVFEINGLTITALAETKGEKVTVTTQDDVDGIYDMVKGFLKEYNSVINEIDKLYNADSAKGYEPMTDEEKEALSESEIEKYEKKIKDALLRGDDTLSSIRNALKETMATGIEIGGETLYLSNFGIETLGYFETAENERSAYHIAGDPDDAATSGKADVLKGMISSDPNKVIDFFTKLSQKLYEKMDSLSSSVDGYRSFGTFYEDKKMKTDYSDYTKKIKELEEKLADYEDMWYKKFAAMETTLAKMQSNTNALTGLLGG